MNYITPEQFKKHFTVQGDTVAVTPSASLCARSLGYSVYFCPPQEYCLTKNKRMYDTVLVDIPDGFKFPEYKSRHEYAWLKLALSYAKQTGVIHIKSNLKILSQLRQFSNLFVEKIEFESDYVYLKCYIQNQNTKLTSVSYSTGEKIAVNVKKSILLQSYNQKHIDYVNVVDSSSEINDYSSIVGVSGKMRHLFLDLYKESKENGTYGLLIQNNTKKLQVSKLENQSCNSSADVYFFKSQELRDKYFNIFQKYDIIKLADNLACNGEMNKKVQSYLMNPLIFDYVVSN